MDAHFHEYLAAITGMRDIYGESGESYVTDFHDDSVPATTAAAAAEAEVIVGAGSHWDV